MGTFHSTNHKYVHHDPQKQGLYPDDFRQLAASILLRAVEDWIDLIYAENKPKPERPVKLKKDGTPKRPGGRKPEIGPTFVEIREFFEDEYGAAICGIVELDSEMILSKLEGWLDDYHETGALPTRLDRRPLCGGSTTRRRSR